MSTAAPRESHLKCAEIARDLNISPSTPVRWVNRGVRLSDGTLVKLKHTRLPGGIRVKHEDLDAFLDAIQNDRIESPAAKDAAPLSSKTSSKRVTKLNAELAAAGF